MNKLCIFDLDGVLINSRDAHFECLNLALEFFDKKYVISKEDHLARFDGLPTKKKLRILQEERGLHPTLFDDIYRKKQEATIEYLAKNIHPQEHLTKIFKYLKDRNFSIAIASNAIYNTIQRAIYYLNLDKYIDYIISNEDVKLTKPHPEMYWKCMIHFNALPQNTIIVEDSHIGREGAINSGARLVAVRDETDLTFDKIERAVEMIEEKKINSVKWIDKKLNVLIPMAGAGSRFAQAGYTFPKPLIDVNGRPMIQVVVENLNIDANYIYVAQSAHIEKYNLYHVLNLITPGCTIIGIDGLTGGAAVTALCAEKHINNDNPLLIANSDQYVEWNSNECMYAFQNDAIDGGILTFKSVHPKWSYARLDNNGFVVEVAEKKPISDNATVGIYYWKKGSDFVRYAHQMIDKQIRTNGEFYIAPVFNEAIADGKKIRVKEVSRMWGLGVPEDLEIFLKR